MIRTLLGWPKHRRRIGVEYTGMNIDLDDKYRPSDEPYEMPDGKRRRVVRCIEFSNMNYYESRTEICGKFVCEEGAIVEGKWYDGIGWRWLSIAPPRSAR